MLPAATSPNGEHATLLGKSAWALMGLSAWAVLVTAVRLTPSARGYGTHTQLGLPPCQFDLATGVPCPGCGLTTSFAHMAHGHVISAFSSHLMGPVLFLMTLFVALYAPYAIARSRPLRVLLDSRASLPVLVTAASAGMLTFGLRLLHSLSSH